MLSNTWKSAACTFLPASGSPTVPTRYSVSQPAAPARTILHIVTYKKSRNRFERLAE